MKKQKKQLTESETRQMDQDITFIRKAIQNTKILLKKYGKNI